MKPEQLDRVSALQAATLVFNESTGANIKSLSDELDAVKNGSIDLHELMGAAAISICVELASEMELSLLVISRHFFIRL